MAGSGDFVERSRERIGHFAAKPAQAIVAEAILLEH
jgi:hypothetical protein